MKFSKLAFVLLLLCSTLLFCSKSPTKSERPQIIVTEDITEDTVWASGNDYLINGKVVVSEGALLTIIGNVAVLFCADKNGEKGKLVVTGTIKAVGADSVDAVIFKPFDMLAQNESRGIELNESLGCAFFTFCRFENLTYGINLYNTSVKVADCWFLDCGTGVSLYKGDSLSVMRSRFEGGQFGVKTSFAPASKDTIYIIKCVFKGASEVGVEVNNYSKAVVSECSFKMCRIGLKNAEQSCNNVLHNQFMNCNLSSRFYYASGFIKYNNFLSGNKGIQVYGYSSGIEISYNNILDHSSYKLMYYSVTNTCLNVENNWWNSLSNEAVKSFIWTGEGSTIWYGTVDYTPILKSKNIDAGFF